jgi:hypothetical protein
MLREEKAVVETKLKDLKVAYTSLKDDMQYVAFYLSSTGQQLRKVCHNLIFYPFNLIIIIIIYWKNDKKWKNDDEKQTKMK